jgi:hypothetical protein
MGRSCTKVIVVLALTAIAASNPLTKVALRTNRLASLYDLTALLLPSSRAVRAVES